MCPRVLMGQESLFHETPGEVRKKQTVEPERKRRPAPPRAGCWSGRCTQYHEEAAAEPGENGEKGGPRREPAWWAAWRRRPCAQSLGSV